MGRYVSFAKGPVSCSPLVDVVAVDVEVNKDVGGKDNVSKQREREVCEREI